MSVTGNTSVRTYSFKSAGVKPNTNAEEVSVKQKIPYGIKTPIQLAASEGLFEMNTDMAKQVSDNLRNIILTNWGERMGFYDFGANLQPMVFELGSEDGDAIAIQRISKTVAKYMPYVTLQNFQTYVDHSDNKNTGKIGIKVTYKVPRIDSYVRALEILLYVGG